MDFILDSWRSIRGYRPTEEIGRGRFAVVYRASAGTTDVPRPDVALKIVLLSVAQRSREHIAHFLGDLSWCRGLDPHPNIVQILDTGTTPDSLPFVVTELVDGAPIASIRYDRTQALAILCAVLDGLAHLHAHGRLHLGVHPGNVLIDVDGQVRLTDHGVTYALASLRSRTHPSGRERGADTGSVGSPRYMAPEQMSSGTLSPATDVYAAGALLYELLVGEPLVGGRTLFEILSSQFQPRAALPAWLADDPLGAVVDIATERDPDDRFADASAMLAALAQAEELV